MRAEARVYPCFDLGERSRKIITVFGSSRTKDGDTDYVEARNLGRLLAGAGFDLCSGGYAGSMEAVSRGAREGGGRTIGVTVEVIRRAGNQWLDEELRADSIFRRIEYMVARADGFVVLRGGAGTLAEMALTMNLLFLGAVEPRPLVLIGDDWRDVMQFFFQRLHGSEAEQGLLTYAPTPVEAAEFLSHHLA